eukprot:1190964-Prorocentrum_minimum.AAC.3
MRQLGNVAVRGIRGSAAELKGRSAYSRCGSQSQGRREHILDVRANHRGRTEVGKAVREYLLRVEGGYTHGPCAQRRKRVSSPGVDGQKGLRLKFNSRQSSTVDTSIPFSARHFDYSTECSTYIPCRQTAIGWPT